MKNLNYILNLDNQGEKMKRNFFVASILFFVALTTSAQNTQNTQKLFSGDVKLACEAVMCLSAVVTGRPGECGPAIAKFTSIALKNVANTLRARQNFLKLCPSATDSMVSKLVNANTDVADTGAPTPNTLSKQEIEARIAELKILWEEQGKISLAAYDAATACVAQNGRVQDGHCQAEVAYFESKRAPTAATRDEIYRLEELLKSM